MNRDRCHLRVPKHSPAEPDAAKRRNEWGKEDRQRDNNVTVPAQINRWQWLIRPRCRPGRLRQPDKPQTSWQTAESHFDITHKGENRESLDHIVGCASAHLIFPWWPCLSLFLRWVLSVSGHKLHSFRMCRSRIAGTIGAVWFQNRRFTHSRPFYFKRSGPSLLSKADVRMRQRCVKRDSKTRQSVGHPGSTSERPPRETFKVLMHTVSSPIWQRIETLAYNQWISLY
jgi:hypothetical protein